MHLAHLVRLLSFKSHELYSAFVTLRGLSKALLRFRQASIAQLARETILTACLALACACTTVFVLCV